MENNTMLENPNTPDPQQSPEESTKKKRHLIHPTWLRRSLKALTCIIVFILLIPVLIYLPPIQTLLKNIACNVVENSTGMKIEIDKFRLNFPLDVSLQGVNIIEASGDTMVAAREAIADVKLLPLLKLDVKVNKLLLLDGYYRMVASDSSMIMKIRAGFLEIDDKTSVAIKQSDILLNNVKMRDGDVSMYMNVWKKQPTPQDTTSVPFRIQINDLDAERIKFAMSMLPTIDTLSLYANHIKLREADINLRTNNISARSLALDKGNFTYLTPTPQYIASHPAPVDTTSTPSAPMVIKADSISLNQFDALYAMKGAKPLPGFDASYLKVSDIALKINGFYNEGSSIRLPIASISAKERCGLQITEGSGTFSLDSVGIALEDFKVKTAFSRVNASATIPFALMAMKPDAPFSANADISLGIPDIEAFMPSLSTYTKLLPQRYPLSAVLIADGSLKSINIERLDAAMRGFFSLRASGYADNALDFKKIVAALDIDGELIDPKPIDKITGGTGFDIPAFKISGNANANRQNYAADLSLRTSKGNLAAKGKVSLNAETYKADVNAHKFDLGHFVPGLGLGTLTATLQAEGAGFNPTLPRAHTDVKVDISEIVYNHKPLHDISLRAALHEHEYMVDLLSPNRDLNLDMYLQGHILPDDYSAKGYIHCLNADLQALGLDTAVNSGSLDIIIDATAQPEKWCYDGTLTLNNLDWNLPGQFIHLPNGIETDFYAGFDGVRLNADASEMTLAFRSRNNLKDIIDRFMAVSKVATTQLQHKYLNVDTIQQLLPQFDLHINSPGRGLISELLAPQNISIDSISAGFHNDSIITGYAGLYALSEGSLNIDTITLGLNQRGRLLDYRLHVGNKPGTLDEFANINLNGYLGDNRLSAYLTQHNIKGENGYRLGMTAALQDSIVTVHFTPLRSMIAYMPWTFNSDNNVQVNLKTLDIDANLRASSNQSAILLETRPGADDLKELHVKLENIHVQDFLNMSVYAPPLTATVNSDIRVKYTDKEFVGIGKINITDFIYNKIRVGNLNLSMNAGMQPDGASEVEAGLLVDNHKAAVFNTRLISGENGLEPEFLKLILSDFPLSMANPFIGADMASLSGGLSGEMEMSGTFTKPLLNGSISFRDVSVFIPMLGSGFKFDNEPVTVTDNVLHFNKFDILGANSNPLTIDGIVNAKEFSDISFDLTAIASNMLLINNDQRSKSMLYGKLPVNLQATVRGPMNHFDINANLNILGGTNLYVNLPTSANDLQQVTGNAELVKFVNLNDTTAVADADSIQQSAIAMRISAVANITPGAKVTVNLSTNGTDKVQISPSGTLNYFQNFMGDMTLNGQLNIGNGFARYSIPVMGEKMFTFDPQSYILWNGDIMSPLLNIQAFDNMKVNVVQGGNTQMVNFKVMLNVSNNLSNPKVVFDLTTDDDMTIENQLQGMTAEQRSQQAINLLITKQYSAQGVSTASGPLVGMNNVYSFLTSQINSWAAKNIRGVDLSFGVDQYDKTVNGENSTAMSYSYQVSKSLFNNRFKINVGGNYSTDASSDENLTENLISDISFEYMLKQTSTLTMAAKLFRHNGYESVLEGEITETGVGFVLTRKLSNLNRLFKFRRRKSSQKDTTLNSKRNDE